MDDELKQHEKLIQLIRDAAHHDAELRKKYHVGDKFRFVRDRLQKLLEDIESHLLSIKVASEDTQQKEDTKHQISVYVYLYNAQGLMLKSWSAMFTPKVFYEYSVNRPIYAEKSHVESFLRSKINKHQHAYLTIMVNRDDITMLEGPKDALGNPSIKVREGSLRFDRLVSFTHNEQDYVLNKYGELVKK